MKNGCRQSQQGQFLGHHNKMAQTNTGTVDPTQNKNILECFLFFIFYLET